MSNLINENINKLRELAKKLGVSAGGSKKDIATRIEEHESNGVTAPPRMLGDDVKPTKINARLNGRAKKATQERKALEKRVAKRGGVVGEAK